MILIVGIDAIISLRVEDYWTSCPEIMFHQQRGEKARLLIKIIESVDRLLDAHFYSDSITIFE